LRHLFIDLKAEVINATLHSKLKRFLNLG